MAINPETGLEDPNYTPPVEETALGEVTSSFDLDPTNLSFQQTPIGDTAREASESALAGDSGPFDQYVNPADEIAELQPKTGTDFMTPESTVAGQLERLLGEDSAIRQQGRVQAREGASALGMMSSSAAIGDVRRKEISALTPVAAKDAEITSGFQMREQVAKNEIDKIQVEATVSGAMLVQKAEITEQATRVQQGWEGLMKGADADTQAALTELQGKWQMKAKGLEADITRELRQQEIDANVEAQIINSSADAMNNYQITVQQLLANDGFLDNFAGNQEAMYGFFDDLFVTVESSMRYSAKAAGVYDPPGGGGLKSYIDDLAVENAWA